MYTIPHNFKFSIAVPSVIIAIVNKSRPTDLLIFCVA